MKTFLEEKMMKLEPNEKLRYISGYLVGINQELKEHSKDLSKLTDKIILNGSKGASSLDEIELAGIEFGMVRGIVNTLEDLFEAARSAGIENDMNKGLGGKQMRIGEEE